MKYEYGVAHISDITEEAIEATRADLAEEWIADKWIREWEEDGGKKGAFVKIRRPIGEWEVVK
jgi:hypothetical protein